MAKLVPAICPKCGANVKLDPDHEVAVCQFCGTSSFVETRKRPVTQYVQAQAMPVIRVAHVASVGRGCAGAVGIAAALLGVGGAIAGILVAYFASQAGSALTSPSLGPTGAPVASRATPGADANGNTQSAPTLAEDYFADASKARAHYQAVLGKSIRAKQLVLMQYYATLEAQDPKNPEHVDSYKLWASKVERPKPVALGADKPRLPQLLFLLDEVDFRVVPSIIKLALADLKIEDGKVQLITLERDAQGQHEPIWRIVINGSRDNGTAEFSLAGEKLRVVP